MQKVPITTSIVFLTVTPFFTEVSAVHSAFKGKGSSAHIHERHPRQEVPGSPEISFTVKSLDKPTSIIGLISFYPAAVSLTCPSGAVFVDR